jgi:hypothetical protein
MELVLMLLSDGADPNTTFLLASFQLPVGTPISCWNHILFHLARRNYDSLYISSPLYGLIEAFLNKRADLHLKVKFGMLSCDAGFDWLRGRASATSMLVYGISARYILTEILRHDPQFSEIEKRFESAGAETSRRVLVGHHEGSKYSKPISEQDSQYLLEANDEYESKRSTSTSVELWNKIGEVSTRDPGDECHCRECTR